MVDANTMEKETVRLYDKQPYETEFETKVVSCEEAAMAAAALPARQLSSSPMPRAQAQTMAAVKASPAAVVSTAVTGQAPIGNRWPAS